MLKALRVTMGLVEVQKERERRRREREKERERGRERWGSWRYTQGRDRAAYRIRFSTDATHVYTFTATLVLEL